MTDAKDVTDTKDTPMLDRRDRRGSRRRSRITAGSLVAALLLVGGGLVWMLRPEPESGTGTAQLTPERCAVAQAPVSATSGLEDPAKLQITRQLITSAENSTLDWQAQYGYIQYNVEGNEAENRGYTAGIVGFTSRTHDMLELVQRYTQQVPGNPLAPFVEPLQAVDGTSSREGLGQPFVTAWREAANDPRFQALQRTLTDEMYVRPGLTAAHADGLGALGQYIYVDALVMHGPGPEPTSFDGIRSEVLGSTAPPSRGGDETDYLEAFLDRRQWAMEQEDGHRNTSRVEAQRAFLREGNLGLTPPLSWTMYGDRYQIAAPQERSCS